MYEVRQGFCRVLNSPSSSSFLFSALHLCRQLNRGQLSPAFIPSSLLLSCERHLSRVFQYLASARNDGLLSLNEIYRYIGVDEYSQCLTRFRIGYLHCCTPLIGRLSGCRVFVCYQLYYPAACDTIRSWIHGSCCRDQSPVTTQQSSEKPGNVLPSDQYSDRGNPTIFFLASSKSSRCREETNP